MRSLSEADRAYLEHLHQFDVWNAQAMLAIVATFGIPPTHLDIGCGTGAMVKTLRKLGTGSDGVDLLVPGDSTSYLQQLDASEPFDLGHAYDLVTCIEVAEHIPEKGVPAFLGNIDTHLNSPGLLVFTAAGPGQAGENHQFLRPGYWWRTEFHNRGITYREDYTSRLRLVWSAIPMPQMWLAANLQVFDR